jgi:hypothetical protein
MEQKQRSEEALVLEELAKAAEQYERYLEIARVTEVTTNVDTIWQHDPSTPLTLIIR